jgi:hypothetical protein
MMKFLWGLLLVALLTLQPGCTANDKAMFPTDPAPVELVQDISKGTGTPPPTISLITHFTMIYNDIVENDGIGILTSDGYHPTSTWNYDMTPGEYPYDEWRGWVIYDWTSGSAEYECDRWSTLSWITITSNIINDYENQAWVDAWFWPNLTMQIHFNNNRALIMSGSTGNYGRGTNPHAEQCFGVTKGMLGADGELPTVKEYRQLLLNAAGIIE